jgi:hypothetical protein
MIQHRSQHRRLAPFVPARHDLSSANTSHLATSPAPRQILPQQEASGGPHDGEASSI